MAVIQWNQFYDKILIGKSLCPLTMKSEGTCVCGGKITFKTSGQQVMITPPLSMREAGQVVYSNPLFKKEDIKTVQKKEQEKSDTPLTQYSKNAFVNSVRVSGTVNVSLRVHGNEKLLFLHTLIRDADPSTPVKWDITHNGKDISVGLLEPPLRSFFTEEGEYKVFAYVQNRGSKKGGGYVTLTVSEPKFVSLEWKDANEKATRYMGRRNVVYAHTKFEGTRDIPVEARFYYKSLNGKQYLTNFAPLRIEQDGMAKIELSLTSSQVEEIKKVPIEKTLIYMELFSKEWVKDLKLSEKTPIEYTDKEDITSIAFYRDKDCKEAVKGFVESGQTIYARVTTRGLDDSYITLLVCRHDMEKEEGANLYGGVYLVSGDTNSHGIAILEIKTDTSWLKEKQSETFDIFVLEGGAKETAVIMPNGRGYTERNTTKFFQMGKDKGILLLSMPKQDVEVGQSKTMVQEVKEEKNNCICKKYDLIWGRKVDCAFRKKVVQIAKNIGLPQEKYEGANWLMAIMALETQKSFNPSKQNRFGYTGLIQLGEDVASRLGTTTSALKRMSAVNQLDYVEKYFSLKEFNGKLNTLTDLYLAVLYPTACGHGKEKEFIVLKNRAYKNNPLFFKEKDERDKNGKAKAKENGKTYVWEIEEVIYQLYKEGIKWKELQFKNCEETEQLKPQTNRIEDVEIVFEKGVDSTTISESSIKLLKEMAKNSNNTKIHITSTVRTPRKQAQIMYSYIVSEGLQNQYTLYGPNGDKVIDVYVKNKKLNKSKDEIINAMEAKIKELGPDNVSRHCGNHSKRNVFDISYNPTKLANAKSFLQQINLKVKDKSISKFIDEKKRNCYHIEIIQKK